MTDWQEERKAVVLWDIDIVWVEDLKEALKSRGILCDEVDSREELYEMMEKETPPVLCILSEQTLKEAFSTIGEAVGELKKVIGIPMAVVLEKDDTFVELAALRAGAQEVLFKEREVEIAVERILLLLGKREWMECSGDTEKRFDRDFIKIHLTNLEKQVLYEMYEKENQVVSRQELLRKFWQERENTGGRVVDTIIKQLRKKLRNTSYQIQGIYGKGYLLRNDQSLEGYKKSLKFADGQS